MLVLTTIVVRPFKSYAASLLSIYKNFLAIFVCREFWNLKIKFEKFVGLKMVVFLMKYEHQINCATVYSINLDDGSKRLLQNGLINLIFTV